MEVPPPADLVHGLEPGRLPLPDVVLREGRREQDVRLDPQAEDVLDAPQDLLGVRVGVLDVLRLLGVLPDLVDLVPGDLLLREDRAQASRQGAVEAVPAWEAWRGGLHAAVGPVAGLMGDGQGLSPPEAREHLLEGMVRLAAGVDVALVRVAEDDLVAVQLGVLLPLRHVGEADGDLGHQIPSRNRTGFMRISFWSSSSIPRVRSLERAVLKPSEVGPPPIWEASASSSREARLG